MSVRTLLLIFVLSYVFAAVSLLVQDLAWPPVFVLAARLTGLDTLPSVSSFVLGYFLAERA